MISVMIFDFTGKYIFHLYFMVVLSSYATYTMFYWVIVKDRNMLQKICCVIVHILYLIAVGLAFVKNFGT